MLCSMKCIKFDKNYSANFYIRCKKYLQFLSFCFDNTYSKKMRFKQNSSSKSI